MHDDDDRLPDAEDRTGVWPGADRGTRHLHAGSESTTGARLAPGTLVGDRYRIFERLGGGSMGEVYRAEDLRLGQDVALKFLGSRGHGSAHARQALLNELRLARRVTHPYVCRVHDLGEFKGQPFVSMEHVRGEDLGKLLHRIGRMHGDKAIQMARQVCAGVQAAHEQGVLHRDLKPANILIDHDGNVRITDFGIAAADDGVQNSEPAGSPAYMAPELLTGAAVASVASDVYALGLVLFEMFSGRRLFAADSMTTLLEQHRQPILPLSQVVPHVDRRVEGVVLACLQRDSARRPPSALAVLAELPGGDPLAEALAAGQTPSPALVAAAAGTAKLSPRRAVAVALLTLVTFAVVALIDPSIKLLTRADLPLSDEILSHHAREHVRALGCDCDWQASAHGFQVHGAELARIETEGATFAQWDRHLQADPNRVVSFWWRGAPHLNDLLTMNVKGRVDWNDPPHATPGMVRLELDPRGRLRRFAYNPRAFASDADARVPPSDDEMFARAGLALAAFTPSAPRLLPTSFADQRSAWERRDGQQQERVELARLAGWPVAFERLDGAPRDADGRRAPSILFVARVLVLLLAAGLAWHALWRRHADLSGAARIGVAIFALVATFTVLTGDHGGGWGGVFSLALQGMSHGLAVAAELAVYYLALEPHARRIWPRTMTSWSRLLSGRWRDPQVAASVLAGAAVGCITVLLHYAPPTLQRAFGAAQGRPLLGMDRDLELLAGTGPAIGVFCEIVVDVTRESMMIFVALVVLRLVLRRELLAGLAAALIWTYVWGRAGSGGVWSQALSLGFTFVSATLVIAASIRFGLLALVVGFLVFALTISFPIRPDVAVWYSTITLLPVLALVVLVGAPLVVLRARGDPWRAARASDRSAT